ncbi:MAG TPA: NUDIX domain-containing protein [Candidatus Saccharimonadales bacterium]|nr:NUDIX domain-containing protein [Candidatus Saccharimonadales bacterium]
MAAENPSPRPNNDAKGNQKPGKSRMDNLRRPIEGFRKFVARRPAIQEVVHETTSGGIVFRRPEKTGELEILLIKDAKNRWTIPKGHVEEGEEPQDTAAREIREETGLQEMEVYNWLGKVNFRYRRNHTLVLMTMHIYLVKGIGNTDRLHPEDWLSDIQWLPATKAVDSIAYEDIGKLMLLGMKKVREAKL